MNYIKLIKTLEKNHKSSLIRDVNVLDTIDNIVIVSYLTISRDDVDTRLKAVIDTAGKKDVSRYKILNHHNMI